MRIAFLTPVYPPMVSGASLVIHRLAKGMASRGHDVLVLTSSDCSVPYRSEEENLTLVRLTSFRNPLRVGQRLVIWPYGDVMKALDEFAPDILHISDPMQFALPALRYARLKKIPSIYAIQQLPWFLTSYLPNLTWLKNLVESIVWIYGNWLAGQYDAITTPTRTIAKIVETKTGVATYAISNGVDLDHFTPTPSNTDSNVALREKLNIPADVPIILHVGRLDIDKQVDTAIRACVQTLKQTDTHLVIAGDGQERPRLQRLCRDLGIESKSHFLGFVSTENGLPDIYRLANVFVMSSQIETQGIVLLEAAASGIPIVALNATCIPEIVVHCVNGYLVEPGQIRQMGEFVRSLIQNPEKAQEMGRAGRKLALKHSLEQVIETYENLFFNSHASGESPRQDKIRNRDVRSEFWKY